MSTYRGCTYESGFYPLRWLHQKRFELALDLLGLKEGDSLLDYGCGDAQLLKLAARRLPAASLAGYEPAGSMREEALENLGNSGIPVHDCVSGIQRRFSKIVCLETCEHLSRRLLEQLFTTIAGLLDQGGLVLISVPVETGPSSLVKNAYRYLLGRKFHNLTILKIIKAALGMRMEREAEAELSGLDFIYPHIGFDHAEFGKLLEKHFAIEGKRYSPANFLGPVLNNTVYFVCRPLGFAMGTPTAG